ncbi:MAG TPA: hypothetical protein PLP27_03265 [Crocinitomicaceae bacterium]|nr:hypothetical protein [Crocinitomicaceae bacterium]
MKNLTYALLTLFISLAGNATILTVNNNNPSPGQYSDLQVAIDAANAGDTLLIHRSPTSYGNATITKQLTLIGEGVLTNKAPLTTDINIGTILLTFNSTTLTDASHSKLVGLRIATLNVYEKDATLLNSVDSVSIMYCRLVTVNIKNNVNGLTITNSMISTVSSGYLYNSVFKYNLIATISSSNSIGANNLFMNNIIFTRLSLIGGIVANNVFYCTTSVPFALLAKNTIFSNNIMYGEITPFVPTDFSTNGNTSADNKINENPLFVNPIAFTALFAYSHTSPAAGPFADFHLQAGSPAIGAGTDGKDLGIYGGSTPWRDGSTTDSRYRYYPLPDAVPVITGITVQNPVVNEGGNLQIQLNATTAP